MFALSGEEAKDERFFADNAARKTYLIDEKGVKSSKDYWLRSPATNKRVGQVGYNGYAGNAATLEDKFMRPAMYIDLHSDACVQRTEAEGAVTWEYDVENTAHSYAEPTYTWSEDYSACTAATTCTKCGATLSEEGKILALHEFLWDSFLKLSHTF